MQILFEKPSRRKNYVLLDVGAHEGQEALPELERGTIVHSFEPDERNCAAITKKTKRYIDAGFLSYFDRNISID